MWPRVVYGARWAEGTMGGKQEQWLSRLRWLRWLRWAGKSGGSAGIDVVQGLSDGTLRTSWPLIGRHVDQSDSGC